MGSLNIDITPGRRKPKGNGLKWVFGVTALGLLGGGLHLFATREEPQEKPVDQPVVISQPMVVTKAASAAQPVQDPSCKSPPTWQAPVGSKTVCSVLPELKVSN